MDRLRIELDVAGHPAHFVGINVATAADFQQELVDRAAFPLFQEVEPVDAMALHQAHKDDLLVYDAQGRLAAFLPMGGELTINLATPEGYANLRRIILDTERGEP